MLYTFAIGFIKYSWCTHVQVKLPLNIKFVYSGRKFQIYSVLIRSSDGTHALLSVSKFSCWFHWVPKVRRGLTHQNVK